MIVSLGKIWYYVIMEMLNDNLLQEFEKVLQAYNELDVLLCSVEVMSDNKLFEHYRKEKQKIEVLAKSILSFNIVRDELDIAKQILELEKSPEEKKNILVKVTELENLVEQKFNEARKIFVDQKERKIQEIRIEVTQKSGENMLPFLSEQFLKFASSQNAHYEFLKQTEETFWLTMTGEGVFEKLKNFSGVIKKTQLGKESLCVCVVLLCTSQDFEFNEKDVEVQTSRSGGAGGQHINKTESAVRLVHIPTGIVSECQDERSQLKNKERAMQALKNKILQKIKENSEKYIKNQRNTLKNAIFSETAVLEFDFDKNEVVYAKSKFKLKQVLENGLLQIL